MRIYDNAKGHFGGIRDGVKGIGDDVGEAPTQGAEAFRAFSIVIVLIGARVSLATPSFIRFYKKQKRGGQRNPLSIFYKKRINEGAPCKYNLNQHRFSFENLKPMQSPKRLLPLGPLILLAVQRPNSYIHAIKNGIDLYKWMSINGCKEITLQSVKKVLFPKRKLFLQNNAD